MDSNPLVSRDGTTTAGLAAGSIGLVFRPGLPSGGPYYETWPEIQTIIAVNVASANPIPIEVIVNSDNAAVPGTAEIPGATGVTECAGLVTITCIPAPLSSIGSTSLLVKDGATLVNVASLDGKPSGQSTFEISWEGTTTRPFSWTTGGGLPDESVCFMDNVYLASTGTTSMADVVDSLLIYATDTYFPTVGIFNLSGALEITVKARQVACLTVDNFVIGTAGGSLSFQYDSNVAGGATTIQPLPEFSTLVGAGGGVTYQFFPNAGGYVPTGAGTPVTANYQAHPGEVVHTNSTGGPFTVTLPSGGENGVPVVVKSVVVSPNDVTIAGGGVTTVDGGASVALSSATKKASLMFILDAYAPPGGNYDVIGL